MEYKIRRYKGAKLDQIEIWSNYPIETVRLQALQWVKQGAADRVHVRNSLGKLVIRYPECRRPTI